MFTDTTCSTRARANNPLHFRYYGAHQLYLDTCINSGQQLQQKEAITSYLDICRNTVLTTRVGNEQLWIQSTFKPHRVKHLCLKCKG